MSKIKTKDVLKGTIKTIDKAAIATERMKSVYAKTKDKAETGMYAQESSADEYAADRVQNAEDRIVHEGVYAFDKEGRKAIKATKKNVVKAKDGIKDTVSLIESGANMRTKNPELMKEICAYTDTYYREKHA